MTPRHSMLFAAAILAPALLLASSSKLRDVPFLAVATPKNQVPIDTFESYAASVGANGLNGGSLFGGSYVDRANASGIQSVDTIESYTDGASVSGLNAGGFGGAYTDTGNLTGVKASDTMESYSDGANLNSLNGGTGWAGAFVDR